MNILLIHPYNWTSGPDIVLLNIIRFLTHSDFKFFCLLPAPRKLSDELQRYGVDVQYCPELSILPRTYNPLKLAGYFINLFKGVRAIKRLVQQHNIDLIHTSEIVFWGGGLASKICNIPSIYHCQSLTAFSPRCVGFLSAKIVNKLSDQIICVSYTVSETLNKAGVRKSKLRVVYNGVDLSKLNNLGEKSYCLKKELMINGDKYPVIGMIGGLDPRKGHKYFIKAASLIKNEFPNALFILVGPSPVDKTGRPIQEEYWNELQRLIISLKLNDSTSFLGERDDIPELISIMDIIIQPSEIEAGPIVPLESLACGKPVIATNVGALPEYLEHGRTAILVPPHNSDAIAKAAVSLLRDRRKLLHMGELGKKRVKELFNIREKVCEIERIYLESINESRENSSNQNKSRFSRTQRL